ncbi:MAG TPA: hypothetical protein VH704_00765 [Casimicrobiaceae bacterium]|nr:hypothetical protein [Casimicrobiaceae bacterium]
MSQHQASEQACDRRATRAMGHVSKCGCRGESNRSIYRVGARQRASGKKPLCTQSEPEGRGYDQSTRKEHERGPAKLQREHENDARDKNLDDKISGFKAATKNAPILDGDRALRIVGRAQRLCNPAARDKQRDPYQSGNPWLEGQLAL